MTVVHICTAIDKTGLLGFATYALAIETGTVITHFNADAVCLLVQKDVDIACFIFAGTFAIFRRLDTVGNCVAQQVLKGRDDTVEHAAIEFDLRAVNAQLCLFAHGLRGLPHNTVQTFGDILERHRVDMHQVAMHAAGQKVLAL